MKFPPSIPVYFISLMLITGGCGRVEPVPGNAERPDTETALSGPEKQPEGIQPEGRLNKPLNGSPGDRFVSAASNQKHTLQKPKEDYFLPLITIPSRNERLSLKNPKDGQKSFSDGSIFADREVILANGFQKFSLPVEKYFVITFDNDIFSNTDYYYTSGMAFELFHPGLRFLPTSYLLPSAGTGSVNNYSLSLFQTLYTPIDPDNAEIQYGDRPFASYLVLGHSNISNNSRARIRITSRIDLGVIGPAALGGYVQRTVHDVEPSGWQNQISNDLVMNYFIQVEKGFRLGSHIELMGEAGGQAGTLFTNLSAGAGIRISNASGYFESVFLASPGHSNKNRLNYFITLSANGTLVGYDATLQGGLTGQRNDVYCLPANDISRPVFRAQLQAGLNFRRVSIEADHQFLTPEFNTGKNHMWTRVRTIIRF